MMQWQHRLGLPQLLGMFESQGHFSVHSIFEAGANVLRDQNAVSLAMTKSTLQADPSGPYTAV